MVMAALSKSSSTSSVQHLGRGVSASRPSARPAYLRPVSAVPTVDAVAAELERIGTVGTAVRGKTVIEEGDPAEHVFKVVAGALRAVRLLPDGRRYVTKFLLPGDYFGFTEGDRYGKSVEVVGDATFIRYSRHSFDALLERDPAVGRRFFDIICGELSAAQDRLLLLGRKSAMERLATFLLGMADRKAENSKGARKEVKLPMNRSDVADYLGLTVETISRLLTHLRADRIIELPTPNHVVFLKRESLEDISNGAA